jgi:hypothetical protein
MKSNRFQLKHMENQRMSAQQMAEWKAAYAKPMKSSNLVPPKETREKPDVVVQYAFGEYGEMDTKDTFSASFWKPR